jgi:hypothetical protein
MSLELGGQLLALVSLLITAPLALRSRATEAVHARLIGVAMFAGYCTLAVAFGTDALMRQPLSPTLRFTRGFAAGIGVGLVLAGVIVAVYDIVTAARAGNRSA